MAGILQSSNGWAGILILAGDIGDSGVWYGGLFVAATEGELRGQSRQFYSTVTGAECSGPVFNPDNTALWASVQHPGEGGTLEEPVTLWPDGEVAPRPSVVLITKPTLTHSIPTLGAMTNMVIAPSFVA